MNSTLLSSTRTSPWTTRERSFPEQPQYRQQAILRAALRRADSFIVSADDLLAQWRLAGQPPVFEFFFTLSVDRQQLAASAASVR